MIILLEVAIKFILDHDKYLILRHDIDNIRQSLRVCNNGNELEFLQVIFLELMQDTTIC